MALFNRSFFDLNNKRSYCLDGAIDFPAGLIGDMKLSVPHWNRKVFLAGLLIRSETIQLLFTAGNPGQTELVASYSSDQKSMIRIGEVYSLKSVREGYGGTIVFGEGLRNDCEVKGPVPVSEECCSRYEPSSISYAAVACDLTRLRGEVHLAGQDTQRLVTNGVAVPEVLFSCTRALKIGLIDTQTLDTDNPMIDLANGVNSYFPTTEKIGPLYKIWGAMPDKEGTVRIRFDEHFVLAPVLSPDGTETSALAVGTDIDVSLVCGEEADDPDPSVPDEDLCKLSDIKMELIPYE